MGAWRTALHFSFLCIRCTVYLHLTFINMCLHSGFLWP